MIQYRPFRNGDPPALAELWCRHESLRGLARPITAPQFDQLVLSKPYFDRDGLIVAEDDGRIVGFAHAGFGPNSDASDVSTDAGVTAMVMVPPHPDREAIADGLLAAAESFLRGAGTRVLYGGGIDPLQPFYLGLYGGSELPGVLQSHDEFASVMARSGYREIDRSICLELPLDGFRPVVDRRQVLLRRAYQIESMVDPPTTSWWEACTCGAAERTRFDAVARDTQLSCGRVTIWQMELFSAHRGVLTTGLVQLYVEPRERRQGLATLLLGESIRRLQSQGVGVVEAQVKQQNKGARGLFAKLGFREVDQGIVFRKETD